MVSSRSKLNFSLRRLLQHEDLSYVRVQFPYADRAQIEARAFHRSFHSYRFHRSRRTLEKLPCWRPPFTFCVHQLLRLQAGHVSSQPYVTNSLHLTVPNFSRLFTFFRFVEHTSMFHLILYLLCCFQHESRMYSALLGKLITHTTNLGGIARYDTAIIVAHFACTLYPHDTTCVFCFRRDLVACSHGVSFSRFLFFLVYFFPTECFYLGKCWP